MLWLFLYIRQCFLFNFSQAAFLLYLLDELNALVYQNYFLDFAFSFLLVIQLKIRDYMPYVFQLIRIFKSSELREENCYLVLFAVQGMIFGPPIVLRKADFLVLVQLWNQPTRGHRSLDFFFLYFLLKEGSVLYFQLRKYKFYQDMTSIYSFKKEGKISKLLIGTFSLKLNSLAII